MKGVMPDLLEDRARDSSYGRLLRRLDQAMDMARTREWLSGQGPSMTELELSGLSSEDRMLLWRIIDELQLPPRSEHFPSAPAHHQTRQQSGQHR